MFCFFCLARKQIICFVRGSMLNKTNLFCFLLFCSARKQNNEFAEHQNKFVQGFALFKVFVHAPIKPSFTVVFRILVKMETLNKFLVLALVFIVLFYTQPARWAHRATSSKMLCFTAVFGREMEKMRHQEFLVQRGARFCSTFFVQRFCSRFCSARKQKTLNKNLEQKG